MFLLGLTNYLPHLLLLLGVLFIIALIAGVLFLALIIKIGLEIKDWSMRRRYRQGA